MRSKKILLFISILNLLAIVIMIIDMSVLYKVLDKNVNDLLKISTSIIILIINVIMVALFTKYHKKEQDQNRFITNSIHALRTPISIINGNLEMLYLEYNKEYVSNIKNESSKIEKLTNNLMNYSILEENVFLKKETFNASEVIKEECEMFDVDFKVKDINFIYNIKDGVFWNASKGRTIIMVTTLLENSSKYTTGNVWCELTSEFLEISNETHYKDGDYIHLFERFKRNTNTNKGFGVGLSIVKLVCDSNKMIITAKVVNGVMKIRISI